MFLELQLNNKQTSTHREATYIEYIQEYLCREWHFCVIRIIHSNHSGSQFFMLWQSLLVIFRKSFYRPNALIKDANEKAKNESKV